MPDEFDLQWDVAGKLTAVNDARRDLAHAEGSLHYATVNAAKSRAQAKTKNDESKPETP